MSAMGSGADCRLRLASGRLGQMSQSSNGETGKPRSHPKGLVRSARRKELIRTLLYPAGDHR